GRVLSSPRLRMRERFYNRRSGIYNSGPRAGSRPAAANGPFAGVPAPKMPSYGYAVPAGTGVPGVDGFAATSIRGARHEQGTRPGRRLGAGGGADVPARPRRGPPAAAGAPPHAERGVGPDPVVPRRVRAEPEWAGRLVGVGRG